MRIKNAVSIILAVVLCTALTAPLMDSAQPTAELTESPEGWSEDVRLTNHTNANRKTNMATEGDEIHIVWERFMGEDDGYYEVFYMKSEDNGRTWSEPLRMSEHEYSVWNPDIAVHGDHVHVVWDRLAPSVSRQTYYRRSTDGGETWHPERMISRDDGYDSVGPTIAVSDDGMSVHVVWVDERHEDESWPPNTELYYNRSLDGGETWEGEVRLTDAPYYSASQQIAVEGETVHVLWSDARYEVTSGDLFYKVSYDNGETWSDDFILADTPDSEISGAIAVDENTIHVIWVRMVGSTYYLYYRNSTDNGETWNPQELLWGPYDLVSNPDISVLGDKVNVVWAGRIEEGEDAQIYFKESLEGGISWEDDLRLTYSVNNSWQPSIALVDSMKHVVWNDLRHGNREIYYKRNPDFISESGPPEIYDVNVTDVTEHSAVVEWKTDRECDGTVRYSENPDFSDNETVSESYLKQEHSFPLEDLTFNTTYYFEVSSTDENGNTTVDDNDGEYYSFTTLDHPPPDISNVSVTDITEHSVTIRWDTDGPSDSTVRYSMDPDLSGHDSVHDPELVVDHTVVLDDLEDNTTYYFEVQSTSEYDKTSVDDNDGEYYSFTTAAVPPPEITDVSVIDITEFSAVVEWSTDKTADSTVRYSEDHELEDHQTVHSSELVTDHTLLLDDLTHNTTYYFEVSSLDEEGYSSTDDNDGEYYSFTTLDHPPPDISNVSVTNVTEHSAVVEWSTDRPADSTVRYSENADLSGYQSVYSSSLVTDHSLLLEGLEHNTTYYFEVQSTSEYDKTSVDDNDGEYYSFTTAAVPPPEITDVSVIDITEFSAVVEWSTDKPGDSTVRYSEDHELEDHQTVHSSELVTDHTLLLDDLTHNTTYYFEVSSLDEEGYSSTDDNDGEYYSFTTVSVPPPEINDLTDDEAYTGEEFTFEAEVSSLLDISDVQVEYRIDPGTINSVSLDETAGIWQHVTSLPEDTVEIEYHITAWDSDGTGNSTETRTVDVVDIIPPEADAGSDMDIKTGELVTFNGTGSEDNIGVVRYHWQMEIGGSDVELLGATPTFEFTAPGEYVVTLTVEDAEGNTDSDSITVTVHQSEEKDPPDETGENVSSLWWILIIPIALVIIISLRYRRRKKS